MALPEVEPNAPVPVLAPKPPNPPVLAAAGVGEAPNPPKPPLAAGAAAPKTPKPPVAGLVLQ
jgi:hypothetical protein